MYLTISALNDHSKINITIQTGNENYLVTEYFTCPMVTCAIITVKNLGSVIVYPIVNVFEWRPSPNLQIRIEVSEEIVSSEYINKSEASMKKILRTIESIDRCFINASLLRTIVSINDKLNDVSSRLAIYEREHENIQKSLDLLDQEIEKLF